MATSKIAISLEERSVAELDQWVREGKYPNRSRAIQAAVDVLQQRERRLRLALACEKLNVAEEQNLAEEFMDEPWPPY